ncbi:LacI family DNA-binding transcriptional regulator [Beijerinckia indica]|uniref:Transcriptional regulator, LacI family n=1 Tax=Beijerinckia indica subsp. indica (strain ATCC 9039 / DSM 1715 / NCIMB 8712) TaxID=395963 RepID=B2IID6_BEII9|nr:transcriptional regulator, LacI family [Beijerinckia indica subsp. indica ATCC 9039]
MAKIRSMEEFAAASGISRPTLSKYFSDPSSVRKSTRQRIETALVEHEYRPNIFAISQNRKRPMNVGILIPHLTDPYFAELVRHIEARCASMGFWAIILSSHGDPDLEERALRTLLSLKLAGAIVAPLGTRSNCDTFKALCKELPIVFLDSRIDLEVPFVGTDNRASIELLVEYLVRTGEPPCFLDMPHVNQNALERRQAFEEAARKAKFEPHVIPARTLDWNFEQIGFDVVTAYLRGSGLPSRTLLCANDRLAFGALAAAYKSGLKVGREDNADLRIAGHDDHPLSRFACPSLTTIAQDYEGLASSAFDILVGRLDGEENMPTSELLSSRLVMRDSA